MKRLINFAAVIILAIIFVIALHYPLSTIGGLLAWQITMNIITDPLLYFEHEMIDRKVRTARASLQPNHYQQVKQMFDDILNEEEEVIGMAVSYDGVELPEDLSLDIPTPAAWERISTIIGETTTQIADDLFLSQMEQQRSEQGFC